MITWMVTACAALLLDQLSKHLVRVRAAHRGISRSPFPRIRLLRNPSSLGRENNPRLLVLIWVVALLSAIALYASGHWFQSTLALCGLGLAFGGAAGNLLDILRFCFVVDFVDLGWWPVFNLADAAIVAGLAMAFWPKG
jgi:signal peptidase II